MFKFVFFLYAIAEQNPHVSKAVQGAQHKQLCNFTRLNCTHAPINVSPRGWGHILGIRQPKVTALRNLTNNFGTGAGP